LPLAVGFLAVDLNFKTLDLFQIDASICDFLAIHTPLDRPIANYQCWQRANATESVKAELSGVAFAGRSLLRNGQQQATVSLEPVANIGINAIGGNRASGVF
jgi:hypothetical protein